MTHADGIESEPRPAPADPAPFDSAELLNRVGGDVEFVAELAAVFAEDWPRHDRAVADALGRADAPALARVAHGVKGTLGTLAAGESLATAVRLEESALAGDLARAAELFGVLQGQVARLQVALARLGRGEGP